MVTYYLDTNIWIDYLENRKDKLRPLGEWAHQLLRTITENKDKIIINNNHLKEMENHISNKQIEELLKTYKENMEFTEIKDKQTLESKAITRKRNIPAGDALHAIMARDNDAILVTRDHPLKRL